jgi:hypothetical protein
MSHWAPDWEFQTLALKNFHLLHKKSPYLQFHMWPFLPRPPLMFTSLDIEHSKTPVLPGDKGAFAAGALLSAKPTGRKKVNIRGPLADC